MLSMTGRRARAEGGMRIVHSHYGGRMVLALVCLVAAPIVLSSQGFGANPVIASSKRLPSTAARATGGIIRLRGGSPSPGSGRVSVSPSGSVVDVGGGGSWAKKLFPVAEEGGDPAGEEREGRASRPRDSSNVRQRSQSSAAVASRSLSKEEESAARDTMLQPVFTPQLDPPIPLDTDSTPNPTSRLSSRHTSSFVAAHSLIVAPMLGRAASLPFP